MGTAHDGYHSRRRGCSLNWPLRLEEYRSYGIHKLERSSYYRTIDNGIENDVRLTTRSLSSVRASKNSDSPEIPFTIERKCNGKMGLKEVERRYLVCSCRGLTERQDPIAHHPQYGAPHGDLSATTKRW